MKKIFLNALCFTFLSFGFSCYAGSSSQKSAGPYSFRILDQYSEQHLSEHHGRYAQNG